jgi:hypothetical protein
MPVWVVADTTHGGTAYCTLNEGLGKVLRYGAYEPSVVERLRWMRDVLGPALAGALRRHGPLDIRGLIAQALQMGDEGHNRNRAGTSLLLRELLADLVESALPTADLAAVTRFVNGNDHFFLNLVMPAGKVAADAARGIPGSTMVVAMARNGTEFGIQTAGTGDTWFTGPAGVPDGLYLGSYGPDDANPDIGDSTITETSGIGGFAMAAAPAIVALVGGTVDEAMGYSRTMNAITTGNNPNITIPALDFMGVPSGIDVRKVMETGILPVINTAIAHKEPGIGMIGAGITHPPVEAFQKALRALADTVKP